VAGPTGEAGRDRRRGSRSTRSVVVGEILVAYGLTDTDPARRSTAGRVVTGDLNATTGAGSEGPITVDAPPADE
jgi:hypothetical protein